jgi:ketosteroid isomerase-like protein
MTSLQDHTAIVEQAFAASSRGDAAAQLAYYTDDILVEVMFANPPLRIEGREQFAALLERAYEYNRLDIAIDEVVACAEADQLIVEFHADGVVNATGAAFTKQYIARIWFRDRRISRQREFSLTR